ncbi:AAA family ATPase [Raoultella ornithinolytica]|uniref:AAA family ATPase n=1 Tax=Raoultella ornithinolytica TaxID=54291 RepID=UPI00403D6354
MLKLKKQVNPKPSDISTKSILYNKEMFRLKAYLKLNNIERARTRAPFNKEVLSSAVIDELKRVQNNKCAYCEIALGGGSDRFISHYRPLSNAIDPKNNIEHVHCYSWFAYEWQNLMLICEECNSYKLNYFPIMGRTAYTFSSWKAAQIMEQPILLNPFEDNPTSHLMFDTDGMVFGNTEQGKATVDLLNLNRPSLQINRKKTIVQTLELILFSHDNNELSKTLSEHTNDANTYAGAIRNCLSHVCRILQNKNGNNKYFSHSNIIKKIIRLKAEYSSSQWEDAIKCCKINHLEFVIQNTNLGGFSLPKRYSHIRKIEINQFKGIEHFSLDFDSDVSNHQTSCTMLLGENATGKSSILQAIALAVMNAADRRRLPLNRQDIITHGLDVHETSQNQLNVTVYFRNDEHVSLIMDHETGKFRTIGKPQNLVFGYGSRRYFLSRRLIKNQPCPSKTLFNQAASLPDPTLWLLGIGDDKFNAIARALASLLTLRTGEFVSRDSHSIFIQRHTSTLPIEHLSEGYKSLFAMAVDIMREMLNHWDNLEFAQGVVLVDEIENHLHPRWKMRVMSALRESLPKVQFITSTHDPLCLRGMFKNEVKVLYRDQDGYLKHVEHLPNVANMRIEQILTSDYFGLATTEDPMRQSALETLAKYAVYKDSELSLQERKHRDELLENYGSLPIIGDTIDRQIIAQALTRHIRDTSLVTIVERTQAREESVKAIIEVLKRNRSKYDIR